MRPRRSVALQDACEYNGAWPSKSYFILTRADFDACGYNGAWPSRLPEKRARTTRTSSAKRG